MKKQMKWTAAAMAAVMAFSLTACSGGTDSGSTSQASGTAETSSGEKVTIKFANYALLEDAYTEFWEGVKTGFEAENPDITIEWVTAPYADIVSTVTTMAGGGDKVDMIFGEGTWTSSLVDSGLIIPVTDVLSQEYLDGFYENSLEASMVDGEIYTLPMYMSPFILYYNTDILQKAGVESVPTTYDELLAACEKISGMTTEDGNAIYPFGQTTASVAISGSAINSMIFNFGGEVLTADGQLSIDNDGFKQTFEMLKQLDEKGYTPENCKLKDLRNLFALGQLAMYYDQSWGISGVENINPDILSVTASANPLAGGSGEGASLLSTQTLFYCDNGDANRAACAKLTEYLMSDEVLGDYLNNIVPGYPTLKTMSMPDNPVLQGSLGSIDKAVAAPSVPAMNDLNLELCTLAQAVTVTGTDVDTAIEEFRTAATNIIG
ncbi:extracellular solute-binding protein [Subdoligranulum sp. DSM 109015]|uniref:Extracellular solute-binding protein n=1 Tax=Gemmiger gallinarum TaxID=2779354 RepID=A0ABR9R642_9FIRM|nr:extracellular solute-binding protein [Gemmiger gallinarum]MBE5038629.1 extracellular solute-binding protein [Gemmiger gallinarum]